MYQGEGRESMNNNYNPMSPKKNKNGWLIGVVSAIAVILVAIVVEVGLLGYRLMNAAVEYRKSVAGISDGASESGDEFDFDFDYNYQYAQEEKESEADDDDLYDDFYRDDYYDYDDDPEYTDPYADTDKEYYEGLKDAIRYDLDYSISWQTFYYETDYQYVDIYAVYPEIKGENIPNLDYINDYIFQEVQFWVDSFEEYEEDGYFYEDDSFSLDATAYITYMDEEKISIVFSEYGLTGDSQVAYLYSINVDVKNGVIMTNSSIIDINDEFAVDFRKRNQEQNNAEGYVDVLSDQEIVEYLNSSTMGIVFFTPLGLEVGINIDGGWYTVTYKDYEKYLKKL